MPLIDDDDDDAAVAVACDDDARFSLGIPTCSTFGFSMESLLLLLSDDDDDDDGDGEDGVAGEKSAGTPVAVMVVMGDVGDVNC